MNETIEKIFENFQVPVSFMRYTGKSTDYITYQESDIDNSFYGDDELLNYVDYYDFDIYSKGNFLGTVESVKKILKENGFKWQPSRTSEDMYEDDTGYYHKTLCFSKERNEENG